MNNHRAKMMLEELGAVVDRLGQRLDELESAQHRLDNVAMTKGEEAEVQKERDFAAWAIGANKAILSSMILRFTIEIEDIETLPF